MGHVGCDTICYGFLPSGVIWVLANFGLICHSRQQSCYMHQIVACIKIHM